MCRQCTGLHSPPMSPTQSSQSCLPMLTQGNGTEVTRRKKKDLGYCKEPQPSPSPSGSCCWAALRAATLHPPLLRLHKAITARTLLFYFLPFIFRYVEGIEEPPRSPDRGARKGAALLVAAVSTRWCKWENRSGQWEPCVVSILHPPL